MSKPRDDEGYNGPGYVIKKLENIKTPKYIVITDNEKMQKKPITEAEKKDKIKEFRIDDDNDLEKEPEIKNNNLPMVGFYENPNQPFCQIYDKKHYNVILMYEAQIKKMTAIHDESNLNITPKKYLCRAFSNVMLINEGASLSDTTYIQNAKSDIKKAIEKNDTVATQYKIDLIEDKMLTEIFRKYNEVITKDMNNDDMLAISSAIDENSLRDLQVVSNEKYDFLDEIAETNTITDKTNSDFSPYYTQDINTMLKDFAAINPNGNINEETAKLRSLRITKEGRDYGESRIDDMLDAILMLEDGERNF